MGALAAGGAVLAWLALAGCGSAGLISPPAPEGQVRFAPDQQPLPAGRTPAYRLPATSAAASRRRPIGRLSCRRRPARGRGVHLELYADRLVVPVPEGIGIAPPLSRRGAYVRGGACAYPARTYEPTGLLVIDRGRTLRLAEFFAIWGQPLSPRSLAGFHGSLRAYVGGRRWTGAPGRIPLRPHAEIVLEIGAFVAPHPRYLFPPGL